MKSISSELHAGKILISDGAWGTFLHDKGLKPGECPESWNLTRPDDVLDVARSYILAGADMIETNSFGGSRFKLKHYGLAEKTAEINEAAAKISRQAAGPDRHVLGSVGPTGIILMMGEVSAQELYDAFKEQAVALEQGGADAIIVETMSDLEEAVLAVKAARENTGCEVICTMTFEKTINGEYKTMMGISPAEIPEKLIDAGADIIGSNCGNGTKGMIEIAKELRQANPHIPILIHGNAGIPKYLKGQTVFNETPEETASYVSQLIEAGVNIIGGCCGTTPEHIRQIAEKIHDLSR
ncbi:MAG: methionine synthase [Bacteroides sp. SM23_62_1]|nr:MAG: methionine synthase [Bacteroides sp. SM23_62_1]